VLCAAPDGPTGPHLSIQYLYSLPANISRFLATAKSSFQFKPSGIETGRRGSRRRFVVPRPGATLSHLVKKTSAVSRLDTFHYLICVSTIRFGHRIH
jgi:hypothetical protein